VARHPADIGAINMNADRNAIVEGVRYLMDVTDARGDRFHTPTLKKFNLTNRFQAAIREAEFQ
jgi:hypothetical protein